jgi:calcineurin-like phosphoesterase family protein
MAGRRWRKPPRCPILAGMISRLFGRARQRQAVAPQAPPGSRVYAVGDIHGRVDLLGELHRLIRDDASRHQASRNVVVYLGDYIDRGPESPAVIELLLNRPLQGFERVHLKGNHEDSLLRFLDDANIGTAWLLYGGVETLQSYGVSPPRLANLGEDMVRAQSDLRRKLPELHRRFMAELQLTHAEGDYLFAHAGVRPGVALDRQAEEDLLWIRDEFLRSDAEFGKIVVHGHTITERPDVQPNRIGIDTGAFASGTLTCLVLDGTEMAFLQT